MAHVCQKVALGPVGGFGPILSLLQFAFCPSSFGDFYPQRLVLTR